MLGFLSFIFSKEFSLLKICCTILWISKPSPKSDDNTFAAPGTWIPCCQDCKWCYFSTKQWSSEGIRGMNFNLQNMNVKVTWCFFSDYVLRILVLARLQSQLLLSVAIIVHGNHQITHQLGLKTYWHSKVQISLFPKYWLPPY